MGALELVASKSPLERFDKSQGVGTICRDILVQNGLVMRAVGDTIVVATLRPDGSGAVDLYHVHTDHLNTRDG
jgi:adenosylmethionine-8-amino-7-oxononanoate aminotransferase